MSLSYRVESCLPSWNWSLRFCLNVESKTAMDWSSQCRCSGLVLLGEKILCRKLLWIVQNRCRSKAIMNWWGQQWVQCLRLISGLALFTSGDKALEDWLKPLTSQAGLSSAIRKSSSQQLICVESTQGRGLSHFYKFISKIFHLGHSQFSFALLLYCRISPCPRRSQLLWKYFAHQ